MYSESGMLNFKTLYSVKEIDFSCVFEDYIIREFECDINNTILSDFLF